jgi:crotonobetainyl-CoA:carnitine CoA-transferase CaiB-like acyl-CoA transferase
VSARPPLEGLRVLAIEQYGAGPFGSSCLADLGAEVIKIENPADGGDFAREVGPYFMGPRDSQFFQTFNRNKKSLLLDLQRAEGRGVLRDLARTADAVFDNLRGDAPARLGLTYGALKEANPKIVCAHLSAYGREGSRAAWPGYDYLMQAEAGHMTVTGEPDGPPARYGLSIVDLMSGLACAFGLLAAVLDARRSGAGRDVDVSLFDVALHSLNYLGTWYLNAGHVQGREPRSAHPSLAPSQLFRTRDGWMFVMCNKEKFWQALARELGHPEWLDDPQLATYPARLEHRERLTRLLDAELGRKTTAVWLERLRGKVPVAPVNDIEQALENPFVAEQERVLDFACEDGRTLRMIASPVRSGAPHPARAAPAPGAHTDALLGELGYSAERIEALKKSGALA